MKLFLYSCIMLACLSACTKPDQSIHDMHDASDADATDLPDEARDLTHDMQQGSLDASPNHDDGTSVSDMPHDLDTDSLDADIASPEDMNMLDCEALSNAFIPSTGPADPPFHGTVWYSPQIITDLDPSSFQSLTYKGTGVRQMYDRRSASFDQVEAHLYDAVFGATTQRIVEVQVNPEFDEATARIHASNYAAVIGRLPAFLFRDLDTVWIHDGEELFGGGNNNLLVHTRQGDTYIADGVLEEVFLHEGAHTSLDAYHASDPLWIEAQRADSQAISNYARDNPMREDIAESLGPYLALAHRQDRLTRDQIEALTQTIPNRIKYLQCQGFDMEILR